MRLSFLNMMLALALVPMASASASADQVQVHVARVDPRVRRRLQQKGTVNLVISMVESTGPVLESAPATTAADRGERIAALVEGLDRLSAQSQRPVAAVLSRESASPKFSSYERLWITNQISIRDATAELVSELAGLPGVRAIAEEELFELLDGTEAFEPAAPADSGSNSTTTTNLRNWGVGKIGAPVAWARGFRGQNVTVGLIDTGVRVSHEALRGSHRADHGWFDPEAQAPTPLDTQGHGTAVLSNILGVTGTGVAPGASWIACKMCRQNGGGCPQVDILKCAEFMLCPTDAAGQRPDCRLAPEVINNSWGRRTPVPEFDAVIRAWRAAGIVPVFAMGNYGPFCSTVYYPAGHRDVLGIGATDGTDTLKLISSKGPAEGSVIKPDLVAPGGDVVAAWGDNDAQYRTFSATSLAAPHVTGAIAVLLGAAKERQQRHLGVDEVKQLLIDSAERQLPASDEQCGEPVTPDGQFPNNQVGWGRVHVARALDRLLGQSTP